MSLTELTPPPYEPVTLAEVYAQLRLDPDVDGTHPDDAMLRAHLQASREFVEVSARRSLVLKAWRLSRGSWPTGCASWRSAWNGSRDDRIRLHRPPFHRVIAVSYFDPANQLQTVDPSAYFVTDEYVPELRFVPGFFASSLYSRPDALRVDYEAGYVPAGEPPSDQEGYTSAIPQTLRQAVLIGVQLLYDNLSEADRAAMERMREAMIQTYRIQHV